MISCVKFILIQILLSTLPILFNPKSPNSTPNSLSPLATLHFSSVPIPTISPLIFIKHYVLSDFGLWLSFIFQRWNSSKWLARMELHHSILIFGYVLEFGLVLCSLYFFKKFLVIIQFRVPKIFSTFYFLKKNPKKLFKSKFP